MEWLRLVTRVRVPPSPPVNSPHPPLSGSAKTSENNASGLPECASVEACIPQCSPTGKSIRSAGALAQRARAGTNLSGASAFHVFLPDSAPPSNLAAGLPSCAPIRVRLGVLPHREAQRRASWLGALAQTGFSQWRGGVNTHTGTEIPSSDVGFLKGDSPEEFLANMLAFLEAAAKIANPPPWPDFSPDVLRDIASIQEAVVIEKEVSKGEAGNPTVVARADLLRQDVWNRWRAGAGLVPGGEPLSDVLGKLTRWR